MRPSRPAVLIVLFGVFALATWALLSPLYSSLPTVPWTAIPTVLLLAVGEVYSGWMTKARIERKPGTRPVEPLAVARLAALAKASAHAGAVFAGVFAGFALYTADLLEQGVPRRDFLIAGGSAIACAALVGAALYLEHCCKVPKDTEEGR
ncbi:membrane protein [Streptosporangium violaceochromogenes]|nr:membrane protein [Streptosporangium violaceochromogenes]